MRTMLALWMLSVVGGGTSDLLWGREVRDCPRLERVVVYQDRAQIQRYLELTLDAGAHRVVLEGLPERLDARTLQVSGRGQIQIAGVVVRPASAPTVDTALMADKHLRLLRMQDELADLGVVDTSLRQEAEQVRKMMEQLASRAGGVKEAPALDPGAWKGMLDFSRNRQQEILVLQGRQRTQRRTLEEEIRLLQRELSGPGPESRRQTLEVEVQVDVARQTRARLEVSYLLPGPSWSPVYDLFAERKTGRVRLRYGAVVHQESGEDWMGIVLALSTARPQEGSSHPELRPWEVDLRPLTPPAPVPRAGMSPQPQLRAKEAWDEDGVDEGVEMAVAGEVLPEAVVQTTAWESSGAQVLFTVPGRTDVPSGRETRRVALQEMTLPVTFRLTVAPELQARAYLKGVVTLSGDLPLIEGPASVFLDGTFVAHSQVPRVGPGQTFPLALGVDDRLAVAFKPLGRVVDEGRRRNRWTDGHEVTLRNQGKEELEVEVLDRYPFPRNREIEVELLEPGEKGGGEVLRVGDRHLLHGTLRLAPGEERVLTLRYRLTVPEDRQLLGY